MAWLLTILAFGLALRLVGSSWGLPFRFHPDEEQILTAAGQLSWSNLNPRLFLYPSLFIYQATIIEWLVGAFGMGGPAQVLLAVRLLSALYATATIGLVFLLGRRIAGTKVGLWAAALYAVLGAPVLHAHYGTTDSAVTALVTAAVWLSIRAWQRRSLTGQVGAAIIVGLATSTKYNAAVAAGVPLVAAWMTAGSRRLSVAQRVGLTLAIPTVAILFFIATSPYVALDYDHFLEAQQSQIENQRFARAGFHRPGATDISWADRGLVRNIPLIADDLGPIVITLVLLGFALTSSLLGGVRLRLAGARIDPGSCLLLAIWPLGAYLFMAPSALPAQRYMLPLYPILAVYAGFGLAWLEERILVLYDRFAGRAVGAPMEGSAAAGGPSASRSRWLTSGVTLVLTVLLLAAPTLASVRIGVLLSRSDTRITAMEWILDNVPAGSGVVREHYSPPLKDRDGFRVLNQGFRVTTRSLDSYCAAGFTYFALSSFHFAGIREDSSELFEQPQRWYVRLHRRSLLLRRFPGEAFGFHHPTIEIYRLYCPSGTD